MLIFKASFKPKFKAGFKEIYMVLV